MGRYKKIPFEIIAETYAKKAGNISSTCSALNIDRNTFFKWRKDYEELNRALTDVEESLIDFSESKLLEQIQEGNLTAIIFHLKTKGKNRGYIERQEVTGRDGSDIILPTLSVDDIEELKKINGIG